MTKQIFSVSEKIFSSTKMILSSRKKIFLLCRWTQNGLIERPAGSGSGSRDQVRRHTSRSLRATMCPKRGRVK